MSQPPPGEGVSADQLPHGRDLRRLYDAERAQRQALEAAKTELERHVYDLLAAQDWISAVNSTRPCPSCWTSSPSRWCS